MLKENFKAQTQYHRDEMLSLSGKMCVGSDKIFDFVSSDWLSKCLHEGVGDDTRVGPIKNSNELCPHGRIDPTRITNMKAISVAAVSMQVQ